MTKYTNTQDSLAKYQQQLDRNVQHLQTMHVEPIDEEPATWDQLIDEHGRPIPRPAIPDYTIWDRPDLMNQLVREAKKQGFTNLQHRYATDTNWRNHQLIQGRTMHIMARIDEWHHKRNTCGEQHIWLIPQNDLDKITELLQQPAV